MFEVKLDSNCLNRVEPYQALQIVLQKHSKVFSEQLGCFNGPPVHLHMNEKVKPKYHKPRKVPFSLKEKVDEELERLQVMTSFPLVSTPSGQLQSYQYLKGMVQYGCAMTKRSQ